MAEEKSTVWPYYRAHQVVQAIEILSMKPDGQGNMVAETTVQTTTLPKEFVQKYGPTPGGFVVCDAEWNCFFLGREEFLDRYALVGIKEPVDVDKLRRELEKAQEEADDWRRRYNDLKDGVRNLIE
jgi:hypothetical protein